MKEERAHYSVTPVVSVTDWGFHTHADQVGICVLMRRHPQRGNLAPASDKGREEELPSAKSV